MKIFLLLVLLVGPLGGWAQTHIERIDLDQIESHSIQHFWLKMIDNGLGYPVAIPVIIAKGTSDGPVLGLTAAIHGNELNGIEVIRRSMEDIDIDALRGTIVAFPGLNAVSIDRDTRRYVDEEDLNRNFPGKAKGNRSQQYVYQINEKVLIPELDYLVDMHTASFGRENTLYVRADLSDENMRQMALLQDADIVLNNKGVPSAGEQIAATRTMRAEAVLKGIPTITIEYGNPQVFQEELITRGVTGVQNILSWLKMTDQPVQAIPTPTICKKSYWIYTEEGGYLEVKAQLNQRLKKGETIATLRNPFGAVIREYFCPEDGIVIGRSSNPINMSGGRIIHLGILQNPSE